MSNIHEPTIEKDASTAPEPTISIEDSHEPTLHDEPIRDMSGDEDPAPAATEPDAEPAKVEEPTVVAETEGDVPVLPVSADGDDSTPAALDFSYKVRDEEHQIEEWAQPYIKDEETLKKFKDLYTRGHGLALAKEERDTYKSQYTDLEESVNQVSGIVAKYYDNPTDPEHVSQVARDFIASLGLPKEMFMQYALGELKYQQLPPEQRQAIDMQRAQAQQAQTVQTQAETLDQRERRLNVEKNNWELDRQMADPQYSPIVQAYETRMGIPGSFREAVVARGIYHSAKGVVKQPGEIVAELTAEFGNILQGTGTQTGQVGTQSTPNQQPQTLTAEQIKSQRQKPVLPNVSGQGGVSPVKKGYTSIEQIKARYNELTANA